MPTEYNVTLYLTEELTAYNPADIEPSRFSAEASVTFKVLRPTTCVVMHAKGLEFSAVSIEGPHHPGPVCEDAVACADRIAAVEDRPLLSSLDLDLMTFNLGEDHEFFPGELAVVKFTYTAELGVGLRRSAPFAVCGDDGGSCVPQVLVTAQLEQLGARRVLPVYDAPRFRAKYVVAVQAPEAATVLSNAEEASRGAGSEPGTILVRFQPTPPMPSYLLALTVGALASGPGFGGDGEDVPEVRTWAVPGREGGLALAASLAKRALAFYADYFGVVQPLSKVRRWGWRT
jgi:aminopeptidase N